MSAAALVLPADERVTQALARLGLATVSVIGTEGMRAGLREELPEREALALAGDIGALAVLIARG